MKPKLAIYKTSGLPWTNEELNKIYAHFGEDDTSIHDDHQLKNKWCYHDGSPTASYFPWYSQERGPNFKDCKQVSYESLFSQIRKRKTK